MLYLLDANVLMTAHATYYPVDSVPEFWDFLLHQAQAGLVKMPLEIFEEVLDGSDDEERELLYAWYTSATTEKPSCSPRRSIRDWSRESSRRATRPTCPTIRSNRSAETRSSSLMGSFRRLIDVS